MSRPQEDALKPGADQGREQPGHSSKDTRHPHCGCCPSQRTCRLRTQRSPKERHQGDLCAARPLAMLCWHITEDAEERE